MITLADHFANHPGFVSRPISRCIRNPQGSRGEGINYFNASGPRDVLARLKPIDAAYLADVNCAQAITLS